MTKEYFPNVAKIKFEGKESKDPMAFHYYDAEKVVMGKKMKDWLRLQWHGGTHFVLKVLTSLVLVQRSSLGTLVLMLLK